MVLGRWPPATSKLVELEPECTGQVNSGTSHVPQGMRTPATLGPADDQTPLQQPPHFNTKLYGSTTDLLGSRLCPRHLPSIVSCIRSSPRTAKQKGTHARITILRPCAITESTFRQELHATLASPLQATTLSPVSAACPTESNHRMGHRWLHIPSSACPSSCLCPCPSCRRCGWQSCVHLNSTPTGHIT